jgi:hypothetical protein
MPETAPALPVASKMALELAAFDRFGTATTIGETMAAGCERPVPTFTNEFWTSKQRAAKRLHEVPYRACFKPQLPRFFIERLSAPRDVVYDPFMGRGTTLLESALLGRVPYGCDINPLSAVLARPRLVPPELLEVEERLAAYAPAPHSDLPEELLVFYHPETLREIVAVRTCLLGREEDGTLDRVDEWIRMVAISRLTGHSSGFFSVYTLPPNQAVSVASQRKINERRGQTPPRRPVRDLILRKSRSLLRGLSEGDIAGLRRLASRSLLLTEPASATPEIGGGSVRLVVTSPPFLDVVDYARDNWLRCWFCGISAGDVPMTVVHDIAEWQESMTEVFRELARVLSRGGHVAFEVGEVRAGRVKLEEHVIPCGVRAGLTPELVLINSQDFTKTSNCWGVSNRTKGTNTNRVVLFSRP